MQNLVKNSSTANSETPICSKSAIPFFQRPKTYFHQRLYMSLCLGAGEGDRVSVRGKELKCLCSCVCEAAAQ